MFQRKINSLNVKDEYLFSPDSKLLVAATKKTIHIWDGISMDNITKYNDFITYYILKKIFTERKIFFKITYIIQNDKWL